MSSVPPARPSTPGPLACREFRVPRRGNRVEECEDASAIAPEAGLFAVADGAAESAYGGLWARLLVEGFVHPLPDQPDWPGWLGPLQLRWAAAVSPPADAPPMPYYLEDRFNQGAFATFLGLQVAAGAWQALAVGDSCLFQVRRGQLELAFPLTRAEDFGNTPWLVGSRTSPDGVARRESIRICGDCLPGDRFWLMTDALSQWFLREHEQRRQPWEELERLLGRSAEEFAAWVAGLRDDRRLRNDDVTLIGVCL
jgi:hypothetical protein